MLAPYPDRLRTSRSTPAPSNPNANNANSASTPSSTPTPPPPIVLPTTPASQQHKLFSSRSSTRMRTNSLSSPSLSHHADTPSSSTDHVTSRSFRHTNRRPGLSNRPSTSSGVPDQKHQPPATIPVSPLSTYHPSTLCLLYSLCSPSPTSYPLVEKAPKGPPLHATKARLPRKWVAPLWNQLRATLVSPLLTVLSLRS